MTEDELKACHTRALTVASRVRLPLRARVWKGQAGEFLGAGIGSSLDFQDHRSYAPGDDPRHINWQAYARTGQYTMKLYREEVRPVVDLIFDVSESMFFDPVKAKRSVEVFYLIAESALRSGASLSVHLLRGDAYRPLANEAVIAHKWWTQANAMPATDPAAVPALQRVPLRPNAIRVFVSDLLFAGDPAPMVDLLAGRQGSAILLAPFLHVEAEPDWSGNYEFVDAERQTKHPHRIEPHVLRHYREAYANHFKLWKHATRRHHIPLARISADTDLQSALFAEAVATGALETC